MRRFFIENDQINSPGPFIKGTDAKHIKNVLRLKVSEKIIVFDGSGYDYNAVIHDFAEDGVEIRIGEKKLSEKESSAEIIIAQSFLKEKKMDELIRPLTELGMSAFYPFFSERTVSRPDLKRFKKRRERWEKLAIESMKQCSRSRIPEIGGLMSFDELLESGSDCDMKMIFWEESSKPLHRIAEKCNASPAKILVILGPEGGFSREEIEKAGRAGYISLSLGPRILRAQTAAIAACTLVQHFFGDID